MLSHDLEGRRLSAKESGGLPVEGPYILFRSLQLCPATIEEVCHSAARLLSNYLAVNQETWH
jgi:hypothetical protein